LQNLLRDVAKNVAIFVCRNQPFFAWGASKDAVEAAKGAE
jgi:hypothetical protein